MTRNTSLSIIVPVFNEQFLVQANLSRLRVLGGSSLLSRTKIVVVDDCSSDQTPSVLEHFQENLRDGGWGDNFQWKFIRHERNRSKGASLRAGLEYADTELIVFHDADLEYHPRNLLKMVPLFLEQDADAVFGSRFLPSEFKRALFYRHCLGNRLITFLVTRDPNAFMLYWPLFRLIGPQSSSLTDPPCPQMAPARNGVCPFF
jgi:glycosyltransferase involved in cell wall biosynthesis